MAERSDKTDLTEVFMNDINVNQTTFPTLLDLFQQWSYEGYPDYVTGIWSTDGSSYNLTVGITNDAAGEAGKQEILNLIEDDASVTFVTQKYSHSYLMQIHEELFPYFEQEELGMVSSGVYETENYVGVEFLAESAVNEASLNFIEELKEKYGDAISVTYTEGYVDLTDELQNSTTPAETDELQGNMTTEPLPQTPEESSSSSPLLIAGLIGILLLGLGVFFALRRRLRPAQQTNEEETDTPSE